MSISHEEALKRLSVRTDLKLIEYVSWSKNAKFFDCIVGEYFLAIPRNIIKYNSGHPKRGTEKRKKTLIEKYGVDNALKSDLIKEKIKQTNIKKYGVENPQQNKDIKNKSINTLKKKYGIDNPAKFSSNRIIKETGEFLSDWYKLQKGPKPAYSTLIHEIKNDSTSLQDLQTIFSNYLSTKTNPEIMFESIFGVKHFNVFPNNSLKYKPDFKLSNEIFVNIDGLYWHSETIKKDKRYHFNLRRNFEQHNLRIFQFREDELRDKTEIVKSILYNSLCSNKNKIFARKCVICLVEQKTADEFLTKNHLMGTTKAKHVGLFFENNLVTILSYKEVGDVCKIERFCNVLHTNVVGGFSKLLKHIENNLLGSFVNEIHNWVDLRYGTGKHLLDKDFLCLRETLGWKWTDYKNTFNRLKCRANMDDRKLSMKQHACELKWYKIYDAGQRLYVKKRKK